MPTPQSPRPGEPGYSAQVAISRALLSSVEIREELSSAKTRAEASHSSRVADASNRKRSATQAAVDADRQLQSKAAALSAELDNSGRDASEILRLAGLPSPGVQSRSRSAGSGSAGDVNQTVREINSALTDLQVAVDEHARVRMWLISRARRKIGLPP
jgi:hypothetical protein